MVVGIGGRLVMGNVPSITESSTTIAGYLVAFRTQILLAALLYAIATVLFLWFGVALATAFRRADESSDLPVLVLAGYVLVSVLGFVGISVFAGLTYAMTEHRPLQAIAAGPYTALTAMNVVANIAVAATFAATAVAIMRTHVFPMWLGWFAAVVAVVRLLAAFAMVNRAGALAPDAPLMIILPGVLTIVWVLAASWLLIREHLPVKATGARPVLGH